jgi:hypothetical protein
MVGNVGNSSIVSFWEDFNLKSPRARDDFTDSTKNKVMSFLDEPMVRNIVAQSETTVDFRRVMDEGKILLVKLSPQFKEVSLLIGSIIIGKLLMAAGRGRARMRIRGDSLICIVMNIRGLQPLI